MRIFSVIFGLLLLGTGAYVLFFSLAPGPWRFIGGAVLALLGANLLYASFMDKPSWLSRIGPLP